MVDVKDSVVRLYVKRFVIPRALIFDRPGFVDFKISGKTTVNLRQLLLPESFFVALEKQLVTEFGAEGEQTLYSIGKRFGYSFALNGRFENIKDHPGEAVKDWVMIASKFVEGTYASNISQETDVKNKTVKYELKNFVVCRKLGYDFFLATAGAAGIIAWILQDIKIEGHMYDSLFKGSDQFCKVTCAPVDVLSKQFKEQVYSETQVDDLLEDASTYRSFNTEVDIQYKKSFESYLNAKLFSYSEGIIVYKQKERFFLMEVSGMYLLEKGMKNEKMKKILFDCAFRIGQELFPEIDKRRLLEVMELLSALGWGEVLVLSSGEKLKVIINYFPWTKFYKEIDFLMIGGFLSGLCSRVYGKEIILKKPKVDVSKGHLALLFEGAE